MSGRTFRYWAMNTALAVALWLGFWRGIDGALNLVQFYAWFAFVLSLFLLNDDAAKEFATVKPAVPVWVDGSIDGVVTAVLVWHGWWWTGAALALSALIVSGRRENGKSLLTGSAT